MPGPLIADWIGVWPDATLTQTVFPFAPDLQVPAGTDGRIRVRVKKPDGTPLDCSGGLFTLTIRKKAGAGDPVISRVHTSADNQGNVYFDIAQSDTIGYAAGDYVRSVEGTIAAVRQQVVPIGRLSIAPSAASPSDALTTLYPSPVPVIGLPTPVAQRYLYSPDGASIQWGTGGGTVLNVYDFGAKGDLVNDDTAPHGTDDTAAIQRALNALGALHGGRLDFPAQNPQGNPSRFLITGPLVLPAAISAAGLEYVLNCVGCEFVVIGSSTPYTVLKTDTSNPAPPFLATKLTIIGGSWIGWTQATYPTLNLFTQFTRHLFEGARIELRGVRVQGQNWASDIQTIGANPYTTDLSGGVLAHTFLIVRDCFFGGNGGIQWTPTLKTAHGGFGMIVDGCVASDLTAWSPSPSVPPIIIGLGASTGVFAWVQRPGAAVMYSIGCNDLVVFRNSTIDEGVGSFLVGDQQTGYFGTGPIFSLPVPTVPAVGSTIDIGVTDQDILIGDWCELHGADGTLYVAGLVTAIIYNAGTGGYQVTVNNVGASGAQPPGTTIPISGSYVTGQRYQFVHVENVHVLVWLAARQANTWAIDIAGARTVKISGLFAGCGNNVNGVFSLRGVDSAIVENYAPMFGSTGLGQAEFRIDNAYADQTVGVVYTSGMPSTMNWSSFNPRRWISSDAGVTQVPFSQTIPLFWGPVLMPQQTVSAALAFTVATAQAGVASTPTVGSSCRLTLIADGVHAPSFVSMREAGASAGYSNVAGAINQILIWFDGTSVWYSVEQPLHLAAAPTLSSAAVANATPNQLQLTFSGALSAAAVPSLSAFSVTNTGGSVSVTGVSIAGAVVTLTLGGHVTQAGETLTISYTPPSPVWLPSLQDSAGNACAAIVAHAVTNNVVAPNYVRLTTLQAGMVEVVHGSGWDYYNSHAGSADNYGTSAKKLAAGQDGWFAMTLPRADLLSLGDIYFAAEVNANPAWSDWTSGNSVAIGIYASQYIVFYQGSQFQSGAAQVPASGDIVRIRRAGTTVYAEVSHDSGVTWQTIGTQTGVASVNWYLTISPQVTVGTTPVVQQPQGSSNVA